MSGGHLSKDFFELVKAIGESRTKQEEDRIILAEVDTLKEALKKKNIPSKTMKEYLIRLIYVEMLGHDASFGYIHAVNLAPSKTLLEKRVAYLCVSLTLHANHEFMFLLINSLLTDLKSDNYLETSMSLLTVCRLANAETIPAVLPLVLKALDHREAEVRKKAVMALLRFNQIDSQNLNNLNDRLRGALCDKDPAVMAASLNLFVEVIKEDPTQYKDLVPSFVSILKQVTEHRLPRDFDYHRLPAPWIQIRLLTILALLGHADQRASQGMYEILHEVMKRADIGINVGYAIVYECVRCITHIYPDTALIEDAALSISRFISSDNHNLKYLGVNALASIVTIDAKYAAEHQMTVIDCLEDPDETLRYKTVDLLFSMCNPQNVIVIVGKLVKYLRSTVDVFIRTELVSKITTLAEKFAPNPQWYILTLNSVFEVAGNLVKPDVAHGMMKLIAESPADVPPEEDMRVYGVDSYLQVLQKKVIPDILLQVIAWVLGEYGHRSMTTDVPGILSALVKCLDRPVDSLATKEWIIVALMKQMAHATSQPGLGEFPEVAAVVASYQHSAFVSLQQKAHEFAEVAKNPRFMRAVLPLQVFEQDIPVDSSLSFLNSYVQAALSNGARRYFSPSDIAAEDPQTSRGSERKAKEQKLNFEAYAQPQARSTFSAPAPAAKEAAPATYTEADNSSGLRLTGVSKAWDMPVEPAPAPVIAVDVKPQELS